jgi:hypothetical protein
MLKLGQSLAVGSDTIRVDMATSRSAVDIRGPRLQLRAYQWVSFVPRICIPPPHLQASSITPVGFCTSKPDTRRFERSMKHELVVDWVDRHEVSVDPHI